MTLLSNDARTDRRGLAPGRVFVNEQSGRDTSSVDELQGLFPEAKVEGCDPAALAACVREAVADGAAFVGIAGGDGTLRTAAAVLGGTDTPLLALPAGTRNHFAKDLGIATFDDARAALADGTIRSVDLGAVNGETFVNNSSIGAYPAMVRRREAREDRMPKAIANVVAVWRQLRHGRQIRVRIDGVPIAAWLVFVGNGCYGEGLGDLAVRESLDQRVLDVRVVRADQRFARTRLALAMLLGRLNESPVLDRRTCRTITIDVRGKHRVSVALDGEVVQLDAPLCYESSAGALAVLVPRSEN